MTKEVSQRSEATTPTGVPSVTSKVLENMRANAAGNWRIEQVETLCRQVGLECEPPRGGGSHFKVWSPQFSGILTIPAKRPIKTIYIRRLVALADSHIKKLDAEKAAKAETGK